MQLLSSTTITILSLLLLSVTIFTTSFSIISFASASASASAEYDQLCEEIISLGQRAASYANSGDMDAAENTVEEARQVYKKASSLQPNNNAQAAANLGVFLLNANKFNESIEVLEKTLDQIPDSETQTKTHLSLTVRRAKYGYASMNRDMVYKNGAGDVVKAYEFAQRQLEFTSTPHRTHHQAGTLAAILCEYDEVMCRNSENHFRSAFMISHSRYLDSHMPHHVTDSKRRMAAIQKCMRSNPIIGSWSGHPKITKTKTIYESIHINEISNQRIMINGRDGVITFPHDMNDCSVLSPSSDHYLDLAENLLDPQTEKPFDQLRPAKRISEGMIVLSGIQYHTHSFYHWLCEALPRLVVAAIHWEKFNDAIILIPKLSKKEKFITESMSMIFQDKVRLAEYHPYTETSQYAFVTWDQPTCNHKIGPCHALANELALLFARNEIVRSVRRSNWNNLKYATPIVVVALRGEHATMRRYDEQRFLTMLEKQVTKKTGAKVVAHDSGKMTFGNAMAVYRQAAVVVGVHGGALSNIMACHPGSAVVEVGFTAANARHYAHVSQALTLDYHLVEVNEDPLKRGLGAPNITFDFEKVIQLVVENVEPALERRALYADEFRRDTDPKHDPRAEMDQQVKRDKEAEDYFNYGRGARGQGTNAQANEKYNNGKGRHGQQDNNHDDRHEQQHQQEESADL